MNMIAIADSYTTSYFDAMVRLMPSEQSDSPIWEFTTTTSVITGDGSNTFDMYYGTSLYYSSCAANSLTLVLSNNRREWISSVQIQNCYTKTHSNKKIIQFNMYGRNSDTDE